MNFIEVMLIKTDSSVVIRGAGNFNFSGVSPDVETAKEVVRACVRDKYTEFITIQWNIIETEVIGK